MKDLGIDNVILVRIILKVMLKKWDLWVAWTAFISGWGQVVMNLWLPQNVRNFLTRRATVSFSRTLLLGVNKLGFYVHGSFIGSVLDFQFIIFCG